MQPVSTKTTEVPDSPATPVEQAAATMGRHMRQTGIVFDHVIASPAVRVAETLDAMFDGLGRRLSPCWDRRLYLASAATLLEVVQEAPDSAADSSNSL